MEIRSKRIHGFGKVPLPPSASNLKLHLPVFVHDAVPRLGPVTGGTRVMVIGDNFLPLAPTYCVFQYGLFILGRVVNSTHMTCTTPYLKYIGSVQLHVSLNRRHLSESFTYFTLLPRVNLLVPGTSAGCFANTANDAIVVDISVVEQSARYWLAYREGALGCRFVDQITGDIADTLMLRARPTLIDKIEGLCYAVTK